MEEDNTRIGNSWNSVNNLEMVSVILPSESLFPPSTNQDSFLSKLSRPSNVCFDLKRLISVPRGCGLMLVERINYNAAMLN